MYLFFHEINIKIKYDEIMIQKKKIITMLLSLLLFVLLGVTACLQYFWTRDLQSAEKTLLENTIVKSSFQMSRKIRQELFSLPSLILKKTKSHESFLKDFETILDFWNDQTLNPKILKDIYLFDIKNSLLTRWKDNSFSDENNTDNEIMQNLIESKSHNAVRMPFLIKQINSSKDLMMIYPLLSETQQEDDSTFLIAYIFDYDVFINQLLPQIAKSVFENYEYCYYQIFDNVNQKVIYENLYDDKENFMEKPDFIFSIVSADRLNPNTPLTFDSLRNLAATVPMGNKNIEHQILLKIVHKEGSVSKASKKIVIKNIAASSFILLILTMGISFLLYNLNQTQKLSEKQRDFISTVTHELKTPLAAISSASQNLSDGIITKPEKIKRYGTMIQKECQRLKSSIDYFLLYSKINTSSKLNFKPIDFAETVKKVLDSSASIIKELDFTVETVFPDDKLIIIGDETPLVSVVQNLTNNVFKHAKEGRYLKIALEKKDYPLKIGSRKITGEKNTSCMIMRISDKGHGISKKDQKNIFEPFVRGAYAVNHQIEGSGVGLNLVKRIAEMHNGQIFIENSNNSGTTFVLIIPLQKEDYYEK